MFVCFNVCLLSIYATCVPSIRNLLLPRVFYATISSSTSDSLIIDRLDGRDQPSRLYKHPSRRGPALFAESAVSTSSVLSSLSSPVFRRLSVANRLSPVSTRRSFASFQRRPTAPLESSPASAGCVRGRFSLPSIKPCKICLCFDHSSLSQSHVRWPFTKSFLVSGCVTDFKSKVKR